MRRWPRRWTGWEEYPKTDLEVAKAVGSSHSCLVKSAKSGQDHWRALKRQGNPVFEEFDLNFEKCFARLVQRRTRRLAHALPFLHRYMTSTKSIKHSLITFPSSPRTPQLITLTNDVIDPKLIMSFIFSTWQLQTSIDNSSISCICIMIVLFSTKINNSDENHTQLLPFWLTYKMKLCDNKRLSNQVLFVVFR